MSKGEISRDSIETRVKEIISAKLKLDPKDIKPESHLMEQLGMDSFNSIEVIFEIENSFDLDIPQKEILNISTVAGIVGYIAKRVGGRSAQ